MDQEINDAAPIIPKFPSFLIIPTFMIAALLTVIAYKKRRKTSEKRAATSERLHNKNQ